MYETKRVDMVCMNACDSGGMCLDGIARVGTIYATYAEITLR